MNISNGLYVDPVSGTPYGTIYNFCAASAGAICSSSNSNKNDTTSDLCPAGWRLPVGGESSELSSLYRLEDYNTLDKMHTAIAGGGAAFAFVGNFTDSIPINQGSSGGYWTSKRAGNDCMYVMTIDTYMSSVYTNNARYRYFGCAVRCIADS